ncbi:ABC transporter permease [Phyllobacterium sp. BT25]|uniref:ABC transporter permease n=1 Tax=Phyllobacterium pellucidum TaxID=2740464 RepID=A0A849VK44_9HYPH|nr:MULTISPECIES: ABC transporter permease [Phyllobacterium]NTS30122.1 ABC transporter permease [Phyllobacterium pellucidum]UGY11139.1 ABC transporter permease [Phyllobacterium sp. T1018]
MAYQTGEGSAMNAPASHPARNSLRRILALVRKESWQVVRDPSSIAVGIVMPMILLILFGYGLSFDLKNLPVAMVIEDSSAEARNAVSGFELSPYFQTHRVMTMAEAQRLLMNKTVNGIVRIPPQFARDVEAGTAEIQFVVNGSDANTARIALGYAQGAVGIAAARQMAEGKIVSNGATIDLEPRLWFNAANDSTYFLVPGLIVLVMTLIGALLTALVIAREWERGTFEALFVTPALPSEILLGKTVPYFVLGMLGLALSVIGSQVLFGVPLRGSLWILVVVSTFYLLVALGIGLLISSLTKNQFVASQITLIVTFLPAMMLSGFMFDIRSMPYAIQVITHIFPARYFVSVLQTLFLAGDIWPVILPNAAVLAVMAAVLMTASVFATRKKLG